MSPVPSHKSSSASVRRFVQQVADRGCRVNHQGGGTCLNRLRSARAALDTGERPRSGPRWGLEPGSETRAWTEKVAAGEGLCRGCRASLLLSDDEFIEPSGRSYAV